MSDHIPSPAGALAAPPAAGPGTADVVLIDDHPLLQAGLKALLQQEQIRAEPIDPTSMGPEELVAATAAHVPSLAVVDLGLPYPGGGLPLIAPLRRVVPRVAVLTAETDAALLARCVGAGADAVVSKTEPLDEVVSTIVRLTRGEEVRVAQRIGLAVEYHRQTAARRQELAPFEALSPRERYILASLLAGRGTNDIAAASFVSVHTVRTQLKGLLRKLGVRSQLEAVARAQAVGWRAAPEPDPVPVPDRAARLGQPRVGGSR